MGLDATSVATVASVLEQSFETFLPEGSTSKVTNIAGIQVEGGRRLDETLSTEIEMKVILDNVICENRCDSSDMTAANGRGLEVSDQIQRDVASGSVTSIIQQVAADSGATRLASVSIDPETLQTNISTLRVTPSGAPSVNPSIQPSGNPSITPTANPSSEPTFTPSRTPTVLPSLKPSSPPTSIPTPGPSLVPSSVPTISLIPTSKPTTSHSPIHTSDPSAVPSFVPSSFPTISFAPSTYPTALPSELPTSSPSMFRSAFDGDRCRFDIECKIGKCINDICKSEVSDDSLICF